MGVIVPGCPSYARGSFSSNHLMTTSLVWVNLKVFQRTSPRTACQITVVHKLTCNFIYNLTSVSSSLITSNVLIEYNDREALLWSKQNNRVIGEVTSVRSTCGTGRSRVSLCTTQLMVMLSAAHNFWKLWLLEFWPEVWCKSLNASLVFRLLTGSTEDDTTVVLIVTTLNNAP